MRKIVSFYLNEMGFSIPYIAEILRVSDRSVREWLKSVGKARNRARNLREIKPLKEEQKRLAVILAELGLPFFEILNIMEVDPLSLIKFLKEDTGSAKWTVRQCIVCDSYMPTANPSQRICSDCLQKKSYSY